MNWAPKEGVEGRALRCPRGPRALSSVPHVCPETRHREGANVPTVAQPGRGLDLRRQPWGRAPARGQVDEGAAKNCAALVGEGPRWALLLPGSVPLKEQNCHQF